MSSWFTAEPADLVATVLSTVGIYLAVVVLTRLAGLRSFSKMSGFDFAMTVAIGSVIGAAMLTPDPPLLQAVVGLATLYALQRLVALVRRRSPWVRRGIDNTPVLLMIGDRILDDALRRTQLTRGDLFAKLREANVLDLSQVRAVVLETTGDVSVLHGEAGGTPLSSALLDQVAGRESFANAPGEGARSSVEPS